MICSWTSKTLSHNSTWNCSRSLDCCGQPCQKGNCKLQCCSAWGYFSLLKSAWTPSTDQCRKLISCISWHKCVSAALTLCATAPGGHSMPAQAWWQICRDWQAMETRLRKLHFHKTLSVQLCACADTFIYLFLCAGITSCGVNATSSTSPAAPFTSGQKLGSPDPALLLSSVPSLPSGPDIVLQGTMPSHKTLMALGRKIMVWFLSLRRNWTAHSTTVSTLKKPKCFKNITLLQFLISCYCSTCLLRAHRAGPPS